MTDTHDPGRPNFVLVRSPDGHPMLGEPPEHVPTLAEIEWEPYDAVRVIREALAVVFDYLSETDSGLAHLQEDIARRRRFRLRRVK